MITNCNQTLVYREVTLMDTVEVKLLKERELNRDSYLEELREKLIKKGIVDDFEDSFLIKFLRARIYDVNETVILIDTYLQNFKKYPKIFENVRSARTAIETGFFELIPTRNKTGEKVGIMRLGKWDPSTMNFDATVASTLYGWEMAEMDEETQVNGALEIVDFKGVGLKQLWNFGITEIRLICGLTDGSLPMRWRKLIVVNQNYITDILYSMAKPILRKQFKEQIMFLGTKFNEVHKLISPEILPEEYGGTAEPLDSAAFYQQLEEFEPKLLQYWKPFKND